MKEGEPRMETQESKFQQVDRKSPEIMSALAEAPVYKKQGRVEARPATVGEEITTTREGNGEQGWRGRLDHDQPRRRAVHHLGEEVSRSLRGD